MSGQVFTLNVGGASTDGTCATRITRALGCSRRGISTAKNFLCSLCLRSVLAKICLLASSSTSVRERGTTAQCLSSGYSLLRCVRKLSRGSGLAQLRSRTALTGTSTLQRTRVSKTPSGRLDSAKLAQETGPAPRSQLKPLSRQLADSAKGLRTTTKIAQSDSRSSVRTQREQEMLSALTTRLTWLRSASAVPQPRWPAVCMGSC